MHDPSVLFTHAAVLLVASLCAAAPLRAQSAPNIVIRITVADSSGAAVPDVDLSLAANGALTVLMARSDPGGRATIHLRRAADFYTVTAGKLGFAPQVDTVMSSNDTTSLTFHLHGAVATLGTVRSTASALPKYKRPSVDAAEIAGEKRLLLSLGDVIEVLRPDIAYQSHRCPDGEHLRPFEPGSIPRAHRIRKPPVNVRVYINGEYFPGDADPWNAIYADHIAEIHYVNCFDTSIPGLPPVAWPSLYVVLKAGYDWNTNRGSFKAP